MPEPCDVVTSTQFTLRTLFALITLIALALGAWKLGGETGGGLFLFGAMVMAFCCGKHSWGLALLAIGILVGLLLPALQPARESWTGNRPVQMTFHVMDADTGAPIDGALVRVIAPTTTSAGPASTAVSGSVRLRVFLRTYGHSDGSHRSELGRVNDHDTLEVQAAGYEHVSRPLREVAPFTLQLPTADIPMVVIGLKRSAGSASSEEAATP